ncbi:hypothetical protein PoB_002624800 [Plakobranchus ocellatus]|uniref:Uncharacterized protein n=1 Tax=Plakobranchus ocellatus TaxID=259542 RepID=A0AAV3ZZC9_9GAST|nr:hypothetical protein PoB_002624800 [Plakobranchus ocellatus]
MKISIDFSIESGKDKEDACTCVNVIVKRWNQSFREMLKFSAIPLEPQNSGPFIQLSVTAKHFKECVCSVRVARCVILLLRFDASPVSDVHVSPTQASGIHIEQSNIVRGIEGLAEYI